MDLSDIPALASSVLGGVAGVLVGAWRVGRRTESVTRDLSDLKRDAADTRALVEAHGGRIAQLEKSGAVVETRMGYITSMLEEIRSDVKDMKGR